MLVKVKVRGGREQHFREVLGSGINYCGACELSDLLKPHLLQAACTAIIYARPEYMKYGLILSGIFGYQKLIHYEILRPAINQLHVL